MFLLAPNSSAHPDVEFRDAVFTAVRGEHRAAVLWCTGACWHTETDREVDKGCEREGREGRERHGAGERPHTHTHR